MNEPSGAPGRVNVAADFLRFCEGARVGFGEGLTFARALRPDEAALQAACVEQLRLYVTGEDRVEPPDRPEISHDDLAELRADSLEASRPTLEPVPSAAPIPLDIAPPSP